MSNTKPPNAPSTPAPTDKVKNISAMAWERNYQFSSREQQFLSALESKSIVTKAQTAYTSLPTPPKKHLVIMERGICAYNFGIGPIFLQYCLH